MDNKIPFGKFKGKAYRFLLEPYNKDYALWLLNDCQKTLAFHPKFHEFLKEEFVNDYIKKSTAFSERTTSKFIEMNGVFIEDFPQYRNLMVSVYSDVWKNSSKERLYETFGQPESYPFTAIFFQNTLNAYGGKELCKIYKNDKPSIRYYTESMY